MQACKHAMRLEWFAAGNLLIGQPPSIPETVFHFISVSKMLFTPNNGLNNDWIKSCCSLDGIAYDFGFGVSLCIHLDMLPCTPPTFMSMATDRLYTVFGRGEEREDFTFRIG